MKPSYYEFFAGAGMARAGLEPNWKCLFANDIEPVKAETYVQNWGSKEFHKGDIGKLRSTQLPSRADLAWASFPCQDLSIAGAGVGLNGERSIAFWAYCDLLRRLKARNRAPRLLVLENVPGALTSNGGKDFIAICGALSDLNYRFGAILVDAVYFVPQSRPRLFIIATKGGRSRISKLVSETPTGWCSSEVLKRAYERLPDSLKKRWMWWRLARPRKRRLLLSDISTDFQEFIDEDELLVFDIMKPPGRLTRGEQRRKLVLVAKKNADNLRKLLDFVGSEYPQIAQRKVLLIDDEADLASVRFVRKRGQDEIEQGTIAEQMDELRRSISRIAFLQVTATPYSLYLQPEAYDANANSNFVFKPKKPPSLSCYPFILVTWEETTILEALTKAIQDHSCTCEFPKSNKTLSDDRIVGASRRQMF